MRPARTASTGPSIEPECAGIASDMAAVIAAHDFIQEPVTVRHAHVASNHPFYHEDPVERFLVGQALVEDMTIVAVDGAFAGYAARLLR